MFKHMYSVCKGLSEAIDYFGTSDCLTYFVSFWKQGSISKIAEDKLLILE